MKNKTRFFYNGILLSLTGLAIRGVGIALGAYIARTVGAEGVGINTLVMNIYAFALTFATAGISLTVTALIASAVGSSRVREQGRVLLGAFIYAMLFSVCAALLLALLSGKLAISALGDARTALSLRILSFSLVPAALSSVISGYFIGMKRAASNAVISITGQLARIGLTVFLLHRLADKGVYSAVNALAVGVTLTECAVFAVAFAELVIDRIREGNIKREKPLFARVAMMALPLAASAYVRSALVTLEHSLIPRRLKLHGENNGEALASYGYLHGMALPMLLYPMVPLTSFGSLLVPEMAEARAKGERKRMSKIASRALGTALSYAAVCAVLLFAFSEELGYVIYGSFAAGKYIALLAPIVPIMYLDHVTDNMLKGIGEQVYSMWVNVADAFLSVALVFILLPVMGISGYALVIVGMEAFNFTLSAIRLYRRIPYKLSLIKNCMLPSILALLASMLAKALFDECGKDAGAVIMVSKLIFTVCVLVAGVAIGSLLSEIRRQRIASKTTIRANPSKSE